MLINLLSNALKFTFKGSISIEINESCSDLKDSLNSQTTRRAAKSDIPCTENEKKLITFKVIDTGLGIRDEDKDKLFKLFG